MEVEGLANTHQNQRPQLFAQNVQPQHPPLAPAPPLQNNQLNDNAMEVIKN
jgi:hypothetical protein